MIHLWKYFTNIIKSYNNNRNNINDNNTNDNIWHARPQINRNSGYRVVCDRGMEVRG